MNYKKLFTLAALLAAVSVQADYGYDRPPVVRYNTSGKTGYASLICHGCKYGHDVRINKRSTAKFTPQGIVTNGKNIAVFNIPWLYPGMPQSVTFAADVTLHEIKRGVIVGRTGWDNSLGVRDDGKVFFNLFGRNNQGKEIVSKTVLQTGKPYRLAAVLDCSRDNKSYMELYVNGNLEATGVLPCPPREYSRDIYVGGIGYTKNGIRGGLACTVHELNFFYKDLTRTEICTLAGNIDKSQWTAFKPVVEYGKTKPVREVSGNGVTASLYKMPEQYESMTYTALVKVNELPGNSATIGGRPGFDNVLLLRKDGKFAISVWNAAKSESLSHPGKTVAKPGETYRVTAVVHNRDVETIVTLFVNGKLEAQQAVAGKIFPYGKELWVKGVPGNNGLRSSFSGDILEFKAWGIALPFDMAAKL
ncbi:MAG: hypothetical protein IJZ19_11825 [Lentisphaeria bacterium]|nr:hypothetical protein [Lentisphaeria bacterium]